MANEVAKTADKVLSYQSAGAEVTLTKTVVRKLLCKGSADFTDEHINQFMLMCQFNQLNPFLNEAYLTGYKNGKTGQSDVTMIVSKEALMKRAEANPNYVGIQAGVIVKRGGEVVEEEGSFYLDTDVLVGGWAKVYRSDRKFPIVARVRLSEYDKNRATWNEIKSTMITKVAKVQALREAFPAQLGAMYTEEERRPIVDADAEEILEEEKKTAPKRVITMPSVEVSEEAEKTAENAFEAEGNEPF